MATSMFFRDKHTSEIVGSAVIPSWLWGAVNAEAREKRVSANTVVKTALKEYLSKRRNSEIEKVNTRSE